MKKRLDQLLVDLGKFESREKAKTSIMAGLVYIDGQKADKPGTSYPEDAQVEVRGNPIPYVSRGGLKLEKAMHAFGIDLSGSVCADIGASTGGFTDCMLQHGAKKVYAIDVGYGQLAWKLRTDERVVSMERTNIRYVTPQQIGQPLDFASMDVSFISLNLVLPVLSRLLRPGGAAVALVKPQFEAGREKVGKKGVVRDPAVHLEVLQNFSAHAQAHGFSVRGMTYSPIKGPEGNIEYLAALILGDLPPVSIDLARLTAESHEALKGHDHA